MEIRLIGNDAGEKATIIHGIISRINRNSPEYNLYCGRDSNTFYVSAKVASVGGSSGSPIIDQYGNAVSLHTGGSKHWDQKFSLPLDRVAYAFEYI